MDEQERTADDPDDDGRPLTRAENRQTRKMLAQNAAGTMLVGYLGKLVIFLGGVIAIILGYLQIRASSGGHP